jgi:hypothetical protein
MNFKNKNPSGIHIFNFQTDIDQFINNLIDHFKKMSLEECLFSTVEEE